ncbi:MAG: hypothetical protein AAF376_00425 [Pseudomonadota bacterium]
MSTGAFLLIVLLTAAVIAVGLFALFQRAKPTPPPPSLPARSQLAKPASAQDTEQRRLDALDTVPEGVPLADLLAMRTDPMVAPEALHYRAERLQTRHSASQAPEPMRALAKLLIDTVDAGLPDPNLFHDAARIFLASAPQDVMAETVPELRARFEALGPWLDIDLSLAALRSAQARMPGVPDPLVAAAEARQEALYTERLDGLLARIGAAAAEGRMASGDALLLANLIGKRPALSTRAVSEMSAHASDPVWAAAWLVLEARSLSVGLPVTQPAFRGRAMTALRSDTPELVGTAADAIQTLLDADAAGDIAVLWSEVGAALNRVVPAPAPLLDLADRLGIARPASAH